MEGHEALGGPPFPPASGLRRLASGSGSGKHESRPMGGGGGGTSNGNTMISEPVGASSKPSEFRVAFARSLALASCQWLPSAPATC